MTAIPRGKVLGLFPLDDNIVMYYTTAVIFLGGFSLIHVVMNSTFGQVVRAVRDNEMRAISLGFEVNRFKLLAFTLSAAIAGLAGANKAIAFKLATLVDVHWTHVRQRRADDAARRAWGRCSVRSRARSSLSRSRIISPTPAFRCSSSIGAIVIGCILLFRRGIVGEIEHLFRMLTRTQNRSARYGCMSTAGLSPVTISAISRPVRGPSVRPWWAWPNANQRF